ncbi:MAG: amidohydrolase family protein [Steroidobacteraceae bacterium]|jgi:predicted TIM-barrel fold metal-dependent hydrolase|nr:amidohydrolase family protein [Steroidobacteraceae bacterium]
MTTKDYFILDTETHPIDASMWHQLAPYQGAQRFMRSLQGCIRPVIKEFPSMENDGVGPFEKMIRNMDASGTDMACVIPESFLFCSGGTTPISTNAWMLTGVQQYPDRFIMCPNFGPIIQRGVHEAIHEMEFMAKECGVKVFKFYCPEDTYINDKRLWPFFEKAQELNLVMQVHTGTGYVYGARNKYCHPGLLEDVLYDFYDLRIVAFHFGWPHHRELNCLAATFPNLYISVSFLNAAATWRPKFFQELIGEAMLYATADKIVWGSDTNGSGMKECVDSFLAFQIDEEGHRGWGYSYITEEDRAKIFGLNMAKLLGIEPKKTANRSA